MYSALPEQAVCYFVKLRKAVLCVLRNWAQMHLCWTCSRVLFHAVVTIQVLNTHGLYVERSITNIQDWRRHTLRLGHDTLIVSAGFIALTFIEKNMVAYLSLN